MVARMLGPIVLLSSSMRVGGAEAFVVKQANFLSEQGFSVVVVSLTPALHGAEKKLHRDVRFHVFDIKNKFLLNIICLFRYIFILNPSVIHSHMIHANLIARTLGLFLKKCKIFVTAHSEDEGRLTPLYKIFRTESCFFHVSEGGLSDYRRLGYCGYDRSDWLPNCVESISVNHFVLSRSDLLWVGRMEAVKNLPLLIRAFAKFLDENSRSGVRLVLVGDGNEMSATENLVRSLKISGNVFFAGFCDDISKFYDTSFSVILTSEREGFPTVLLEGAVRGVPFISTSSFVAPSFVELCPDSRIVARSTVDDLAEVIGDAYLCASSHNAHVLSWMSYKVGKRFSPSQVFGRLLKIYD